MFISLEKDFSICLSLAGTVLTSHEKIFVKIVIVTDA